MFFGDSGNTITHDRKKEKAKAEAVGLQTRRSASTWCVPGWSYAGASVAHGPWRRNTHNVVKILLAALVQRKGEGWDERENEWRQRTYRNEAIFTEGDVTRRRRVTVAKGANHTEAEKQTENALRIGCDAARLDREQAEYRPSLLRGPTREGDVRCKQMHPLT